MCDIDYFKKINDHLGHAEGDRCLVEVAKIIQENITRDCDHVARYGGEEFLVLLPGVNEKEALSVGERIRRSVEGAAFTIRDRECRAASRSASELLFRPRTKPFHKSSYSVMLMTHFTLPSRLGAIASCSTHRNLRSVGLCYQHVEA